MRKRLIWTVMAFMAQGVFAQDRSGILVGASLPLSGFNAAAGKEGLAIATAYFDSVNKAGGIGGRRIVLRVLDDERLPLNRLSRAFHYFEVHPEVYPSGLAPGQPP